MDFTELFKQSLAKFSPSGSKVATAVEHRLVIRDSESLQILHLFNNPAAAVGIEWSVDSQLVMAYCTSKVSKNGRGWIRVYSVEDPNWHAEIDAGITGLGRCIFAPDGRHLLAWSEFQMTITIYSLLSTGVFYIKYPKSEKSLSFRSDGRYFAYCERAEGKDFMGIVDCDNWTLVRHFPLSTSDVDSVLWSPDGKFIVAYEGILDFKFSIYSPDGRLLHVHTASNMLLGISSVKWSPSSQFLSLFGVDQKITIINTLTWFPSVEIAHPSVITDTAIPVYKEDSLMNDSAANNPSPSSRQSAQYQLAAHPFALQTSATKDLTSMFAWSIDGRYIASKSESYPSTVFIYDLAKLDFVAILTHASPVKSFEWNPVIPDHLLICCSGSNNVFTWNSSGCASIQIPAAGFELQSVKWNPAGKSLLVADRDKFCVAFPI